jgi:hypothetical protein
MKYKLDIEFKDNTSEVYFTNHLNVENVLPSEHYKDIKTINIIHYEE